MFEKTLQDLVKGIRNANDDSTAYITKAIQEIKEELKSRDVTIKAQALQKLTYLNMLGHDMSWAAFHVIEVMSQERFGLKRVGFLAASQSFTATTDVIVLCTQLLKKEFQAKSPFEIGTAVNTLANIATEDLARDLLPDVVTMLTSSRPYIRKKGTLVLYKLYLQYPQGLRLTFEHLKRRLTDDAVSVVSCAVNVICELARKKPANYLSLAPELFTLLTSSTNNWMTIKIAKLMSALVQEEPRLARKLLEPLANIVQTTPAKSLMYECISTITFALQHTKKADGTDAKNVPAVVRLCTDKLREFVRDPDQNLKYLGLVGLVSLMKSHPRVVAEHRELVLACLLDDDVTIRMRALELIAGMVTRRNLPEVIKRLVDLVDSAEGHYRDELIDKIIFMCSRDKYAYMADFAWYLSVLAKLAFIQGTKHSATIAGQILDVAVRVEEVRPFAIQTLLPMLGDATLYQHARETSQAGMGTAVSAAATVSAASAEPAAEGSAAAAATLSGTAAGHVLYAAAWIVGEYCSLIPPPMHSAVIDALLQPTVATLPAAVQSVYVQCVLKVLAAAAAHNVKAGGDGGAAFMKLAASVLDRLHAFAQSIHVEVQERACLVQQLLATLGVPFTPLPSKAREAEAKAKEADDLLALVAGPSDASAGGAGAGSAPSPSKAVAAKDLPPLEADLKLISAVLAALFSEQLKPVNPKAQKKVAVPDGLDLDKWINPDEEHEDAEEKRTAFIYNTISFEDSYGVKDDEYAGAKHGGDGGVGSGADDDDEAWFADIKRKNKKREKELWGADSPAREKKGKKSKEEEGGGRKSKSRGGDPFLLKSDKGDAARSRGSTDIDVDSIPIKTLGAGELKPNVLDVSLFKDFGKPEKKSKKSKKGKKDDSDEDERPVGRTFRIISEDDMPEGAGDDDDDKGSDGKADPLASVDLSTPLGDEEQLVTRSHRTVGDKGAGPSGGAGRGRGRARVLGEDAEEDGGKKKKKEKDGEKKDKKEKKEKKEEKAEKPAEKKKSSKEEKAAAAAPAPAEEKKKKSKAEAAAPATPTSGDAVAAAEPYVYQLAADKVISAAYAVAVTPAPTTGGAATATVTIKFEPKSSKKAVDWIDVTFLPEAPLITAGTTAGASPGSIRIATGLKPKEKGKSHSKKGALTFTVADPALSLALPVKITYQVNGADKVTAVGALLGIRSAAVLVPTVIDTEAFRGLMTGPDAAALVTTTAAVPLLPGTDSEATLGAVMGILRSYAVARSKVHAILYAKTVTGVSVMGLLKYDEASKAVSVTIKSPLPGHAAVLLADVTETIAAAAAAAAASDE